MVRKTTRVPQSCQHQQLSRDPISFQLLPCKLQGHREFLKYFKLKSKIMKLRKEQQIYWPLRRSAGKRRDLEMICTSKDLKISQLQSSIHTFDWLNILGEGKHFSAQNGINWNTKLWFETWITITMIIIRQHISFGTGLNRNMTSQSIKWMAKASDCI